MKIGIIAASAEGEKTGIGTYTYNLIKSLREIDSEDEYFSISRNNLDENYIDLNHQITFRLPNFVPREKGGFLFWLLIFTPIRLYLKCAFPLIHDTCNYGCFALLNLPCRKVVTIHDIGPIVNQENFKKITVRIHKFLIPMTVKNADIVITDSEFSKNEIMRYLKTDPKKIRVIYPGIDKRFRILPKEEFVPIFDKYNLPKKFILYVGSIHKQKNLQALIRAYALIKAETDCKLVIVGRKMFEGDRQLPALIENLHLQRDIIFSGYAKDEDLPAFYNAASVLVLPSLYEGFGLPPLEAMACGTPVITSNRASLPEAVGEAGIMVDPDDIEGLAKAMVKLTTDEELRQRMIKRGLERVKLFSPEQTAMKTLEVYREVLGLDKTGSMLKNG
jgi:glycosyltransferase involved in cell wall biosynthesis